MADLIGYNQIVEDSMRRIVYGVLKKIDKSGLKGEHHFVIGFSTKFPGVIIPDYLRERYPEEMIIVIQHQYGSLVVGEEEFIIGLSFGGKYEKLTVPYKAVLSFSDPSVNFGLKFTMFNNGELVDDDEEEINIEPIDLSQKVVSLDAFRKNRDKKE